MHLPSQTLSRLGISLLLYQLVIFSIDFVEGADVKCPDVSPCRCRIRNKRRETERKAVDIDCRNRRLEYVPDLSVLKGIPINVLQITYNQITSIEDDAFNGLYFKSVQSHDAPPWLRLDGNPINTISPNAFRGVMADTLLFSMDHTRLNHIPTEALKHLENITQLHLGGNNITSVPDRAFTGLEKLQLISINDNPIKRLNSAAFASTKHLHDLMLKNISLNAFPTDALKRVKTLKAVYLNDNSISVLPDYAFSGFQTQWDALLVSLANNGLTSVHPQAFNRRNTMMSLATVHLENNYVQDMSFLYKPCFPLFRALYFKIHMENNPVNCDCAFYNLASEGLYAVKGSCGGPGEFEGVQFDTTWQTEGMAIFKSQLGPVAMKHCGPAESTHCLQDNLPTKVYRPSKVNIDDKISIEVLEDEHKSVDKGSGSFGINSNSSINSGSHCSTLTEQLVTLGVLFALLYLALN